MSVENPEPEDLYKIGTLAYVKSMTEVTKWNIPCLDRRLERANGQIIKKQIFILLLMYRIYLMMTEKILKRKH